MTSATTDPTTTVVWLTATSSDQFVNGKPVRAYGKDKRNYLVAVRTSTGVFPVENLPAVMAARPLAVSEADAPWRNGDWEDPYEDLLDTGEEADRFLESAQAYQEGRY